MKRLIVLLLLAISSSSIAEEVKLPGAGSRPETVRTVSVGGQEFIRVSDIAKILGGTFQYDPLAGKVLLRAEGKEAALLDGSRTFIVSKSGRAMVSGRIDVAPRRADGQLYLGVDSARSFLKQFHAAGTKPLPGSLIDRLPLPAPTVPAQQPVIATPSSPPPPIRSDTRLREGALAPFIRNIVIDAGHGDHDAGAIGPGGLKEKDVNLDVARKLAEILSKRVAGRVTLTRGDDRFITLSERVAIAKRVKADLFISVHTNSAPGRGGRNASGTEVYFFSSPSDEDARRAERLHGGPFDPRSVGMDPVLFDLMLAGNVIESHKLAEAVCELLPRAIGLPRRGVKSARFYVMYYGVMSNIPSILVELGFISNPDEEAKLSNPEWRTKAAEAIADAASLYLEDLERRYPDGKGWTRS